MSWAAFIPAAVQAGASIFSGIMGNKQRDKEAKQAEQSYRDRLEFEYALKDKYKNQGGGGGGGGGGAKVDKTSAMMAALQQYMSNNTALRDKQSQAFQELRQATTVPLLRR